jgi:hypothetical protein
MSRTASDSGGIDGPEAGEGRDALLVRTVDGIERSVSPDCNTPGQ